MNEQEQPSRLKELRARNPWKNAEPSSKLVNRAFNPGTTKKEKIQGKGVGRRIPVRCIETGEVYPSANAASAAIGLASNAVTCALLRHKKGKAKQARAASLTWEYVNTENKAV